MRAVDIVLDRPRKLRFTMAALRSLEQQIRATLGVPLSEAMDRWHLTVGPILVLHGLRSEDPRLTQEKVEALLQNHIDGGHDLGDVYQKAALALRLSGVLGAEAAAKAQEELEGGEQDPDPTDAAES